MSFLIVFIGTSFKAQLPKSAIKKIDKTLASIWPEQNIKKSEVILNTNDKEKLSFKLNNNTFYSISKNDKHAAYLFLARAKSKISNFDYMVVFKSDLSILKVKVLIYREEYGGEIGSKRWLKQFIGKSDPEKMKFGHDIQNISGATISARNMTQDVKKVMKQIHELKRVGAI
ncbi:MAG: FMN-binding protein [Vicingaceae bacterium]|nr:FMN-binding protein [Vicingaceae bacterium]